MTTIDLLLALGGKIADILMLSMKKKASKQEQEAAQALIEQYKRLREAHTQIDTIVKQYNQGIVQAVTMYTLDPLFPICTHQGYKHVERLYSQYRRQKIQTLVLEDFETLSINMFTYKVETVKSDSTNEVSHQKAHAYTRERWISIYSSGPRDISDVVNRYSLVNENGNWKIDKAEVYVKSD